MFEAFRMRDPFVNGILHVEVGDRQTPAKTPGKVSTGDPAVRSGALSGESGAFYQIAEAAKQSDWFHRRVRSRFK